MRGTACRITTAVTLSAATAVSQADEPGDGGAWSVLAHRASDLVVGYHVRETITAQNNRIAR